MSRSVSRSARSGRFITKATAARNPRTTTTEIVGKGRSSGKTVNRSASTGRFIKATTSRRHPKATIRQDV